jgi:acyl carrier protein
VTSAEVIIKIEPIMRDLFDEYDGPITANLTAKEVDQWDSLANVQLLVMIEKAFGVKFASSDMGAMKNVGALAELVLAKAR